MIPSPARTRARGALAAFVALVLGVWLWTWTSRDEHATNAPAIERAAVPPRESAPTEVELDASSTEMDVTAFDQRRTPPPPVDAALVAEVERPPGPTEIPAQCNVVALAAESHEPISFAEITFASGPPEVVPASELASWNRSAFVAVPPQRVTLSATGRRAETIEIQRHYHQDASCTHRVELGRCAKLRVTCRGPARTGTRVRVVRPHTTTRGGSHRVHGDEFELVATGNGTWSAVSDCLAANVLLSVRVEDEYGAVIGAERELELDAERENVIAFDLVRSDVLRGVLERADGTPVKSCEVWIVPAEDEQRDLLTRHTWFPPESRRAKTDRRGRFEFPSVASGLWLVGPSDIATKQRAPGHAAFAELVDTRFAPRTEPVVVRLPPALTIQGIVRDEHGAPRAGARILARGVTRTRDGSSSQHWLETSSETDGAFELAALAPGEYVVWLSDETTSVLLVSAGARDVVLSNARRSVAGRVFAPDGGFAEHCRVTVVRATGDLDRARTLVESRANRRGEFDVPTGARGDVLVVACDTSAGRVGFARCTLVEARATAHVDVTLAPAGRVELVRSNDATIVVELDHGARVALDGALREEDDVFLVPAGELRAWMRMHDENTWSEPRSFRVVAGETVALTLP